MKPKCRLCGARHNSWEGHALVVLKVVTDEKPGTPSVTPGESCPTCGQRAYRERRRG